MEMVTGDTSGHVLDAVGLTGLMDSCASLSTNICGGKSPDCDPKLPQVSVETLSFGSGMSLSLRVCAEVECTHPSLTAMACSSPTLALHRRNSAEHGSKAELRSSGIRKDPWELELTPALPLFLSAFT